MIPSLRTRRIATVLVIGFVVAGCYSFAEPSFRPGGQRDILSSIVRRGIVVSEPIVGETACDSPEMIANTLYVTARMPDEAVERDVFIHVYRERRWEESQAEVDACQEAYAAARPDAWITRLDIPTYRAFGADWSDELTRELEAALEEAAQAG